VLDLDSAGLPQLLNPDVAGQLTQYIGLMDAVREITYRLGYGPLGGGSIGGLGED
jgi:hypothetical protein